MRRKTTEIGGSVGAFGQAPDANLLILLLPLFWSEPCTVLRPNVRRGADVRNKGSGKHKEYTAMKSYMKVFVLCLAGAFTLGNSNAAIAKSAVHKARVTIKKGRLLGTARIHVSNVRQIMRYGGKPVSTGFYVTVPVAVAKAFSQAAKTGKVRFNIVRGFLDKIRISAGSGSNAVVIRRKSGGDTSLQVQLGGQNYWLGRTAGYYGKRRHQFTGRSGIFRTGSSAIVDPFTLKAKNFLPAIQSTLAGNGALHWMMKKTVRSEIMSDVSPKTDQLATLVNQL
ncbi:MAG: hypothetical protein V1754_07955 [Pseudomonadota bacterium]